MAAGYEYQSIYKEHIPGQSYTSADDVLNDEGQDGWELISVVTVNGIYKNAVYEIFYLARKMEAQPHKKPA